MQFSHGITLLTKREYFAIMALQGIAANSSYKGLSMEEDVDMAVNYADELLEQLEGKNETD